MSPRQFACLIVAALVSASPSFAEEPKGSLEWHLFADTYYGYNFNQPAAVVAPNAASVAASSVPDARNTYRYYDFYHNQISLSLLEFSVLAKYGEVSLLTDLDFGSFADSNAASSSASGKSIDEVSKHLGQAVVMWRPAGSKFQLDVGKMYSHVGAETVKSKDNFNYSRTVLFAYGMPFWHTGLRLGYELVPEKLQASVYLYNGWNSIYDNNQSKSVGAQLKYSPTPLVTVAYNFLGGPERADSEKDRKTVHELNSSWTLSENLRLLTELLYGEEQGATVAGSRAKAEWYGGFAALKAALSDLSYISPRFEIFRDQHGSILSGGPQTIKSGTLTYGHTLTRGLDLRAEGRWDSSSRNVFSKGLASKDSQTTILAALLFTY